MVLSPQHNHCKRSLGSLI